MAIGGLVATAWERVPGEQGRTFFDRGTARCLADDFRARGFDASLQRLNLFLFSVWTKPQSSPPAPAEREATPHRPIG